MADPDVSGPPGNLSGDTDGGADASSVGPGTGQNPDNPAKGVGGLLGGTTGSTSSGVLGQINLQGLPTDVAQELFESGFLGIDPNNPFGHLDVELTDVINELGTPAVGVNVETEEEAPRTHPDFGLSGTALDPNAPSPGVSLTDPEHLGKAVDKKGKALSFNKARQKNLYDAFIDATKNKKTEIDALRAIKNRTRQQNLELSKLQRQYKNLLESDQYSKAMAMNNPALGWGAKALSTALGLGVLGFGPTLDNFATEMGFIDDTTPQDVMDADPTDEAPEGPSFIDEDQSTSAFWSLMNIVRNNRDIFENVPIEKIRELLGDSKKFWEFYETEKAKQIN